MGQKALLELRMQLKIFFQWMIKSHSFPSTFLMEKKQNKLHVHVKRKKRKIMASCSYWPQPGLTYLKEYEDMSRNMQFPCSINAAKFQQLSGLWNRRNFWGPRGGYWPQASSSFSTENDTPSPIDMNQSSSSQFLSTPFPKPSRFISPRYCQLLQRRGTKNN